MKYKIHFALEHGMTAVPGEIIDKHLKLAPPASFKVILCLLRTPAECETEKIAFATGLPENEVRDALDFWMQNGVLSSENDGFCARESEDAKKSGAVPQDGLTEAAAQSISEQRGFVTGLDKTKTTVTGLDKTEKSAAQLNGNQVSGKVQSHEEPKAYEKSGALPFRSLPVKRPTQSEIAERLIQCPELVSLCAEAQCVMGTFGYDTQALLVMIYDYYGFPPSVILMLLQYQKQVGVLSSAAIRNRAEAWAKNGICTLDSAEAEIKALDIADSVYLKLKAQLEMTAARPTPRLMQYLRIWAAEWEFSDEMISLALSENGNSVSEANKLLKKWKSKGIKTPSEVKLSKQKSVPETRKRSYELEKIGRNSVMERLRRDGKLDE